MSYGIYGSSELCHYTNNQNFQSLELLEKQFRCLHAKTKYYDPFQVCCKNPFQLFFFEWDERWNFITTSPGNVVKNRQG